MKSEGEDGIGLATCSERRGMMDCMVAMEWQPEGKRKVGRPKTTWRRTVGKRIQAKEMVQLVGSQGRSARQG